MAPVSATYRFAKRQRRKMKRRDPRRLAMQQSAEDRRCPVCHRKSALRRRIDPSTGIYRWCYWATRGRCSSTETFEPLDLSEMLEVA